MKNKYIIKKFKIIILFLLLILITSCSMRTSGNTVIDGKQLGESSEKFDELNIQMVVETQADKYKRHYQNGLYYEDLSNPQKELNKLYNAKLKKELDNYINKNMHELKNIPYILRTEVEYINEDAKKYSQGLLKAEDIIDNPNSIMSMKIQWYIFEEFVKLKSNKEESIKLGEKLSREYLEKEIVLKYIVNNVENFQMNVRDYPREVLDKYSIKEIEKQEDIDIFLQKYGEKTTYGGNIYSTYFAQPEYYLYDTRTMFEVGLIGKETKEFLKKQYNKEFIESKGFYMPKDNPQLYFRVKYFDRTHFQEIVYQYLVNKRVKQLIEEAGLSNKVVFLVTTEPDLNPGDEDSSAGKPYDFGEGFDEDYFLKYGYKGDVVVTLIYLFDKNDTIDNIEEDRKKRFNYYQKIEDKLKEKIIYPLHEQIDFGSHKDAKYAFKNAYIYFYTIYNDYDRKVILDLFKKYPLTERENAPDLDLYNVFSLQYKTRAETPGFHYLDIFGKYNVRSEINGNTTREEMNKRKGN